MGKRLLLQKYEPIINTYWFWADQLLMLRNQNEGKNWLINNFIEITYDKMGFPHQIYFFNDRVRNKTTELYNCPLWRMQKIDFDEKHCVMGKDILSYVIECLNKNMYILFMVNRKYIKKYEFKRDDLHQILVHGYDDENSLIFFSDNNKNGKFESIITCTYEELSESFEKAYYYADEPDFGTSVFTFLIEQTKPYPVNMIRVMRMIKDYLNGTSQTDNGRPSGINVYLDLAHYYENMLQQHERINTDVRGLCTLHDHKKAMVMRLELLRDILQIPESIIEDYKELERKSEQIINIMLRYKVLKEDARIYQIIDLLRQIYSKEYAILSDIVTRCNMEK